MIDVNLLQVLQIVGPPLAVYVAIRVDVAMLKVRMDRAERDIQVLFRKPSQEPHHAEA